MLIILPCNKGCGLTCEAILNLFDEGIIDRFLNVETSPLDGHTSTLSTVTAVEIFAILAAKHID